jgi:hypothetical protein
MIRSDEIWRIWDINNLVVRPYDAPQPKPCCCKIRWRISCWQVWLLVKCYQYLISIVRSGRPFAMYHRLYMRSLLFSSYFRRITHAPWLTRGFGTQSSPLVLRMAFWGVGFMISRTMDESQWIPQGAFPWRISNALSFLGIGSIVLRWARLSWSEDCENAPRSWVRYGWFHVWGTTKKTRVTGAVRMTR